MPEDGTDISQPQIFEEQVTSRVIALLKQKCFIPPGLQALAALATYRSNLELILGDEVVDLLKRLVSGHDSRLIAHAVHVIAALAEDPDHKLEGTSTTKETVGSRLVKSGIISDMMFALSKLQSDEGQPPQISAARRLAGKGMVSFGIKSASYQLTEISTEISQEELFEYDIMCIVAGLVKVDERACIEMIGHPIVTKVLSSMKSETEHMARKAMCALVGFAAHEHSHSRLIEERAIEELLVLLRGNRLICDCLEAIGTIARVDKMRPELMKHKLAEELKGVLDRQKPTKDIAESKIQLTEGTPEINKAMESILQQIKEYDGMKQYISDSGVESQLSERIAPEQAQPAA
ncbi:hypothetical protein FS749_007046, partial [Ceratobasidium sp. UAMH 11750]